jgi:hypothetical protein
MKSVMSHKFSRAPQANIPRSSFDRSHGLKTTFDADYLVPIFLDEALPGDTFNLSTNAFVRMNTPIYPVMDNMYLDTFFFAIPIRLVWENFKKMMGEQEDPDDSIDYSVPEWSTTTSSEVHTLSDYFGIPLVSDLNHNLLPYRCYWTVINEWFRDENLQDSVKVSKDDNYVTGSGNGTPNQYGQVANHANYPAKRGKRSDYFTSSLPWPQKGESVDLPLGTSADIHFHSDNNADLTVWSEVNDQYEYIGADAANAYFDGTIGPESHKLIADLSTATAATINQLRQAFQVQKLLERDARGGTRYIEIIRSHFGVISPDARLQRPEYLGGGSTPINITPIAQTAQDASVPIGSLSAMGTAKISGHGFTKSFTEHCILIGLANVRADLTYQQGLDRMFSRETRYDFYWPELAQIGEQSVLNKEIYADGSSNDEDVFGYQERYAEYRYKPSRITGLMRSDATGTLDPWHLSQDFASLPTLGYSFIVSDTPMDRVVALPDEPDFFGDFYFNLRCVRPMPLYGVPGLIDHF